MNITTLRHWAEVEYRRSGRISTTLVLPESVFMEVWVDAITTDAIRPFESCRLYKDPALLILHTPYGDVTIKKEGDWEYEYLWEVYLVNGAKYTTPDYYTEDRIRKISSYNPRTRYVKLEDTRRRTTC